MTIFVNNFHDGMAFPYVVNRYLMYDQPWTK